MTVEFDRFFDDDIEDTGDKYLIMDHYEWAITDNSLHGNILTKWTPVSDDRGLDEKVCRTFLSMKAFHFHARIES